MKLVKQAYPLSELNVEGPNGTTVEFFGSTGSRATPSSASTRDTPPRASPSSSRARESYTLRLRGPARGGRRSREGHRPYECDRASQRGGSWTPTTEPRAAPCRAWPIFDYVFIDGAHTWMLDALAFLLVDRLLRVGGYVDFDDYPGRWPAPPR